MAKENLIGTTPAIDAPRPAAGRGEVKEHEAVERGELAAIDERPETLRRMHHEISEGHFTGENERHRPRENPEEEQRAAEEFERPGKPDEREKRRRLGRRRGEVQQFLHAMGDEEKSALDAKHAQ